MRRRKKPMRAITMLQIGIAGVLLICLGLLMVWYTDGLTSFRPKAGTFQYVAGLKVDYREEAVYRNKEGKVEVSDRESSGSVMSREILPTYAFERWTFAWIQTETLPATTSIRLSCSDSCVSHAVLRNPAKAPS